MEMLQKKGSQKKGGKGKKTRKKKKKKKSRMLHTCAHETEQRGFLKNWGDNSATAGQSSSITSCSSVPFNSPMLVILSNMRLSLITYERTKGGEIMSVDEKKGGYVNGREKTTRVEEKKGGYTYGKEKTTRVEEKKGGYTYGKEKKLLAWKKKREDI
ncbi:hypothetical protein POVWA2_026930 [Plasmodium ovale wallikeri]|uniref:Uncharacterized protein n=1 Tax=Plasmodium ovale wallikeri TaxID=864142 RepID=A0A1A8YWI4_PLAOA|nr:hypothetical protein POVWA1_026960 [Plasmodium ovale wallikeri]SBT35816.1 hypothetical protein POVWA2_026930 [Plasmodium ovale wallikeri]